MSPIRKLFGTDGVRGIANIEPMTCETAMRLGRAAAHSFKKKAGRHRIVIGKDTRLSGYMLESAITSGICSMGVDVLLLGPLPTPAVAFVTRSLRADAGVMISASHNPFQDNGIKFFSGDGLKLPDELEARIEELIETGEIDNIRPTADDIGKAFRVDDAEGRYIEFVKNSLAKGVDFSGIKVVVDCANGAAYKVAPMVLRELGAQVTVMGTEPDGSNINRNCGALFPESLCREVTRLSADLGIAHDGDADRALFVDEHGKVIDGDLILAAFALDLAESGRLSRGAGGEPAVVATVMSNFGLDRALKPAGVQVVRTPVGDRYILERMLKEGYNFGGEPSGHVIFLDHNTTGDGLITALQFLWLMLKKGKRVSEITACASLLPQVLISVPVKSKPEMERIPGLSAQIRRVSEKLKNSGRLLVRYSGTEPVLRIMVEGEEEKIEELAQGLAEIVRREIGEETRSGVE